MKAIVIVPAYNEQDNIRKTLEDLKENGAGTDILVMNDCSTDGTEEILREMGVRHLTFPVNLGIGEAYRPDTGMPGRTDTTPRSSSTGTASTRRGTFPR